MRKWFWDSELVLCGLRALHYTAQGSSVAHAFAYAFPDIAKNELREPAIVPSAAVGGVDIREPTSIRHAICGRTREWS